MSTAEIRKKLHNYLEVATDKKIKAIYTMVEDEVEEYNWTKDKKFMAELEKRSEELKSGKVKGITWEEAKDQLGIPEKKKKNK